MPQLTADKYCIHKNVKITESATAYTTHIFSKGEWFHDSDFGEYTSSLHVQCGDCGLDRTYNRHRAPKWLQRRLAEALNVCE